MSIWHAHDAVQKLWKLCQERQRETQCLQEGLPRYADAIERATLSATGTLVVHLDPSVSVMAVREAIEDARPEFERQLGRPIKKICLRYRSMV